MYIVIHGKLFQFSIQEMACRQSAASLLVNHFGLVSVHGSMHFNALRRAHGTASIRRVNDIYVMSTSIIRSYFCFLWWWMSYMLVSLCDSRLTLVDACHVFHPCSVWHFLSDSASIIFECFTNYHRNLLWRYLVPSPCSILPCSILPCSILPRSILIWGFPSSKSHLVYLQTGILKLKVQIRTLLIESFSISKVARKKRGDLLATGG